MKRYTYLAFFLFCIGLVTQYVCAAEITYPFIIENTIRNKTIYGAVYEKLGTSSWKLLDTVFALEYNKPHSVTLSHTKKYVYAFAASELMLNKETITDQEKDALEAKSIHGSMHEKIASVSFSTQNPLNVDSLKITNDYAYPLFIARYVFDPLKKDLSIVLASLIYRCAQKEYCMIPVPVDYKGKDVILVASRTIDFLTPSLDLRKIEVDLTKDIMYVSRSNFEKLKPSNAQKKASELFAENNLTIINDTSRNWAVAIYGRQGSQLHRLAEVKNVSSGKNIVYNKNYFLPTSDVSWHILFDNTSQSLSPLVSLHPTVLGGEITRDARIVSLSRWFHDTKDAIEKNKEVTVEESSKDKVTSEAIQKKELSETTQGINDAIDSEEENLFQNSLPGTHSFQLSNGTTKDVFVGLYARKDRQYLRREKPMKIAVEAAGDIGFEKGELLAFSVSSFELKESLSLFEWRNINSMSPEPYKERNFVLRESDFMKDQSFNLSEITLKNDNYSDIAAARYEQKEWGIFTLCGVVQRIAKKNFDGENDTVSTQENNSDKDEENSVNAKKEKGPNFALPDGYKGFIGYNSAYDEKEYSSVLPEKIETQFEFEMNHLTRIDTTDKKIFDAEKDLTGGCITVENDTNQGSKWVGIHIAASSKIIGITSIAQGAKKSFIPYQEHMKIVVRDDFFDEYGLKAPYGEIAVNLPEKYHYLLTEAVMISSAQAQKIEKDKERAIAQIIQKQKQQERERQKVVEKIEPKRKPIKPKKELEKEIKPLQKPLKFPVLIEKEEEQYSKQAKIVSTQSQKKLKKSTCTTHQIRIINHSGKDIAFRFYYRGFFSTTPVADPETYSMSNGQELCVNLPTSGYLSDRYIVVDDTFTALKESYANKEIGQLMKIDRAFLVEKQKEIIIKK